MGTTSGGSSGSASQEVTFGSNQSDAVPKKAYADMLAASGLTVKVNTVDHENFQENINNYLQGNPDDVFTWFAGYRMRFFAAQGLAGDISDVWGGLSGMNEALKQASTGDDGKQYFVPLTTYPWALFYRKSVWEEKGYEPPKTLDELVTLSKQMQKDGLVPIAFADKDGWPAMGTFDQLNLRINGYQFHVDLMAGKKAWDSPEVKKVFDTWKGLLPYHQEDALGREWQEAAQSLLKKESGMYLLGMFVGQQFPKGKEQDDLDFFAFPEIDPAVGTGAIEAPIDGFMMRAEPKNEEGAKQLLKYLGTAKAEDIALKADPTVIGASSEADTSSYTGLQKKAVEFIGSAESIAQFLDRDTRPDFASTVMLPGIQTFLKNPERHRRADQEPGEPEEVDLHLLRRLAGSSIEGGADVRPANRPGGSRRGGGPVPPLRRPRPGVRHRPDLPGRDGDRPHGPGRGLGVAARDRLGDRCRSPGGAASGGLDTIQWIGTENYKNVFTNYPPFAPALRHNLIWLVFLFVLPTLFGIFLAVLLDRELRGTRFYQTAFFLPVVLSLALIGFIWQLIYSRDQGLLNAVLHTQIDWYGDSRWNLWAVLVAAGWKHAGYIMLLYLAGLKGVDPSLREAAAVDGASQVRTFFSVVFPVMRPINIIVLVVTVIESLRAFDIVWVINKGTNGLELISTLVTSNVVGEASRIGFGSALATIMLVISLVFIAIFLSTVMRGERR